MGPDRDWYHNLYAMFFRLLQMSLENTELSSYIRDDSKFNPAHYIITVITNIYYYVSDFQRLI